MVTIRRMVVLLFAACCAVSASPAHAQESEKAFYAGKTPGIPPDRLAYLQAAVKETLHNAQLIAEGERIERIIGHTDPDSTHKNVVAIVSGVPPLQKARVMKLLSGEK